MYKEPTNFNIYIKKNKPYMASESKTSSERKRMQEEFEQIQSENSQFDISKHLAKSEDLPYIGDIEIYDYDADLTVAVQHAHQILESLVDLYLSELPALKEHPYIKNKMREDALTYAETTFLSKMTRKNFLTQLRQIDNGDNSARIHEVVNQTVKEIRENSKFASSQKTDLEKFYKDFRKDIYEVIETKETQSPTQTEKGDVLDNRKLNEWINSALKKKDEKK